MLDNREGVKEPEEVVESPTIETPEEETPEEETPEIVEEPAEEPTEETVETPEEAKEAEAPKPSRAENRIRDLVADKKRLESEMEDFKAKKSEEFESGEMTYDDLNKVVNERALEAARLLVDSREVGREVKSQSQEWAKDFDQVKSENPQLDPKSPEYDSNLDSTLAKLLDDGSGSPRLDIKVSEIMETLRGRETKTTTEAKEAGKSEASANLVQQVQEGAITPSAQKTASPSKYSDAEISKIMNEDPKLYTELIQTNKI